MELGIHFIDFLPGDAAALTPALLSTATAAEEMAIHPPPRRVTRADLPISYADELELSALPSRERLATVVRDVVSDAAGQ